MASTGVQGLAISVLPLALAAVAQAIVVISGGIDLSVGSMMALTSVVAASQMKGQSEEFGVLVVVGVLLLGLVLGVINGGLVVLTRVPDIVVTLAMSFVWAGVRAPGAGEAGRRVVKVAEGPRDRITRQRVDSQGCHRPDRRHRTDLDPGAEIEVRPVDLRGRERQAGGLPERRTGRPDEDRGLRPHGALLGARRAEPDG